MLFGMGRPRRHDEQTRERLLNAAEQSVEADGIDSLTVRGVADAIGTSTRAVYAVFGSKEGLVIALGARGFDLLRRELETLPVTEDPAADLVEAGLKVFRPFVLAHPALFRIGIQRDLPDPALAAGFVVPANAALDGLKARIERLSSAGLLGKRSVGEATWGFHALCEGLAAMELRNHPSPAEGERLWRDSLTAMVKGLAVTGG